MHTCGVQQRVHGLRRSLARVQCRGPALVLQKDAAAHRAADSGWQAAECAGPHAAGAAIATAAEPAACGVGGKSMQPSEVAGKMCNAVDRFVVRRIENMLMKDSTPSDSNRRAVRARQGSTVHRRLGGTHLTCAGACHSAEALRRQRVWEGSPQVDGVARGVA